MPDDFELAGLDPFDLLDREAARIDAYLSALDEAEWSRPTRCAGWSVRDVLAHLASSEDYLGACLDGQVQAFLTDLGAQGATDLDSANALGIAELGDRGPEEVLSQWRRVNAETRRRFRERGTGFVDTTVGDYPCRWQAFHVASELATHADDIAVPVLADERDERLSWRARFSRFALAEAKPDLVIDTHADHTHADRTLIRGQGVDVDLDDEELVAAVAGRLDDSSRIDAGTRAALSTTS